MTVAQFCAIAEVPVLDPNDPSIYDAWFNGISRWTGTSGTVCSGCGRIAASEGHSPYCAIKLNQLGGGGQLDPVFSAQRWATYYGFDLDEP